MLPDSENHDRLIKGLNATAETSDCHVAAAVRLLIGHDRWARDETVVSFFMTFESDDRVTVNWAALRQQFDAGEFAYASTTEKAVLDFAIALAEDRYRLSIMGDKNCALIREAVAQALDVR